MIYIRKTLLSMVIAGLFSLIQPLWGQELDTTDAESYSAYELLSSYYDNNFKPFEKGNWYLGMAASVSDRNMENTESLLQKVIDGSSTGYSLRLKGGYYIGNYTMAGVVFEMSQNKFIGTVVRSGDTIQTNAITRGYNINPNLRVSFPMTPNERLSFFALIGAGFGVENSVGRDIRQLDLINKSETSTFSLALGLSPGITFFAMENFAFEIQLNLIGYNLSRTKNSINDEPYSVDTRQNINFNVNILTLEMGLAYYFGIQK